MSENRRHLIFAACFAMCFGIGDARAQQQAPFQYDYERILLAKAQLQDQFYTLAAQSAREHLQRPERSGVPFRWTDDRQQAEYIRALSNLKTDRQDAATAAVQLLGQIAARPMRERLSLALARYYFLRGDFAAAIPYYEQAGIDNLSNTEIAAAKFELAYSYFNNNRFADADPLFAIMKEVDGKYHSAGNYYYGLLAYNRGAYEDALKSFGRIDNEPQYRTVVPYYMAELQYFLGNRQQALSDALRLIKRPEKSYYHNELHLLAAQCLFEAQRYGEALPYFEYYYEHTERLRKEELYEMGYSYYQVNEWQHAIDKFKPLSSAQDSLGQTAMYLLGDCYLKTGDKRSARSAFSLCANMNFSKGQHQAALLLYAKLSYELGYSDDALRSLNTLIGEGGGNADAYLLQSQLFAATSNYKGAYESLLLSDARTEAYQQTMQRVAYSYALQNLQQQQNEVADSLLGMSLTYSRQPAYTAAANFWKGELAYRNHRNDEAIHYSQAFLDQYSGTAVGSVSAEATPAHAYLNMGYASLDAAEYAKAQAFFSKAGSGSTRELAATAGLREADAAFMQKDFSRALGLYNRAGAGPGRDADYARLQAAIIYGLQGKTAEKVRLLQSVINTVPASSLAPDARYELAVTEMEQNRFQQAISLLQPLAGDPSSRQLAARSLLKLGTAYQQLDQDDKAIAAYRTLVGTYGNAPERTDALAALKSIYIERNQPDVYAALLTEQHLPAQNDNELEATYYSAAEAQYAARKWPAAQAAFSRYLQQYPNGSNAVKAHYYAAESYYQQKLYREALPEYDAVLQGGWNDFSEISARQAATIAFNAGDYAAARNYYQQLRASGMGSASLQLAYTGLMRSAAGLRDEGGAAAYADTLLSLPDVPPDVTDEARLHQAHQLMAGGRSTDATAILTALQASKNAAIAAEARYYAAQSLLDAGRLKEAEDAASRNIRLSAGNDYWVVKTYILLGDILVKEKDFFNAKATLQSVVQHTKDESLRSEASRKLEDIKTLEGSKLSNE